jgi:hypothetical protein
MSLFNIPDCKMIVAIAGGEYVGTRDGCVLFADPIDGYQMRLYESWCKSPADVAAALKCYRDFVADYPKWEKVDK